MGIIHISKDELLDVIAKQKPIAEGGYGEIFKIDDATLFKYYYEKYVALVGKKQEKIELLIRLLSKKLDRYQHDFEIMQKAIQTDLPFVDRSDASPDQFREYQLYTKYKVMEAQDKIKDASVPKNLVFVDGAQVGSILNFEKGVSLLTFVQTLDKNDHATKRKLEENIYDAYIALMANGIFPQDINVGNILVDPVSLEVKIIDLDDVCTEYYKNAPQSLIEQARRKILKSLDVLFGFEIERQLDFKFKR